MTNNKAIDIFAIFSCIAAVGMMMGLPLYITSKEEEEEKKAIEYVVSEIGNAYSDGILTYEEGNNILSLIEEKLDLNGFSRYNRCNHYFYQVLDYIVQDGKIDDQEFEIATAIRRWVWNKQCRLNRVRGRVMEAYRDGVLTEYEAMELISYMEDPDIKKGLGWSYWDPRKAYSDILKDFLKFANMDGKLSKSERDFKDYILKILNPPRRGGGAFVYGIWV